MSVKISGSTGIVLPDGNTVAAEDLSNLLDQKQSQLNLGVIQTLAGTVFNTDNCTVIQNPNGVAYRFPNGLQVAFMLGKTFSISSGSGALRFYMSYPASFVGGTLKVVVPSTEVSGTAGAWSNDRDRNRSVITTHPGSGHDFVVSRADGANFEGGTGGYSALIVGSWK